jgi:hypothetical protein
MQALAATGQERAEMQRERGQTRHGVAEGLYLSAATTQMLAEVHHTRPAVKQDHDATGQERAEMLRERAQTRHGV